MFARVGLPRILTGVRMESWMARIRLILKARLSLGQSIFQASTGAGEELLVVNRAHIRFARVFMCLCRNITRWVDIVIGEHSVWFRVLMGGMMGDEILRHGGKMRRGILRCSMRRSGSSS